MTPKEIIAFLVFAMLFLTGGGIYIGLMTQPSGVQWWHWFIALAVIGLLLAYILSIAAIVRWWVK